jgi:hypothetical protein
MPGKHAIFSPSGFKALMLCPAKPAMERGLPDTSSDYADEGTAAHFLAAFSLNTDTPASDLIGHRVSVHPDGRTFGHPPACELPPDEGQNVFVVDADMADAVQVYINTVRDYQGDGELLVEQSLPIAHITGEADAEGTGDAVILRDDEIIVIDLKFGRGVEVTAENNPQLMLYGLGALEKYGLLGDFKRVRMVISQPRITSAPSEFVLDVPELGQWAAQLSMAAKKATDLYTFAEQVDDNVAQFATPHPEACRFCKAKGTCPALADGVQAAVGAEFTDLTTKDAIAQESIVKQLVSTVPQDNLGAKMDAVELVEMWCKAIRARCESTLLAGGAVAGYKLVPGKKGARAWADAVEAEKQLKAFRLKREQMFEMTVISPTTAEKLLKPTPKRWAKLQPLIKQGDGKPSVAPVSDPRAAFEVKPIESEFSAIADESAEDLV